MSEVGQFRRANSQIAGCTPGTQEFASPMLDSCLGEEALPPYRSAPVSAKAFHGLHLWLFSSSPSGAPAAGRTLAGGSHWPPCSPMSGQGF